MTLKNRALFHGRNIAELHSRSNSGRKNPHSKFGSKIVLS